MLARETPKRREASRWLKPSTWQASRTRLYKSTVNILWPFQKMEKPQTGKLLVRPQQHFVAASVAHFCTAVYNNLGSHKSAAVRDAIRARGARLLFLPPYSPDLNPIEQTFSMIKHWMRKARGRSVGAVHNALADIIDTITPQQCKHYFNNAGYASN